MKNLCGICRQRWKFFFLGKFSINVLIENFWEFLYKFENFSLLQKIFTLRTLIFMTKILTSHPQPTYLVLSINCHIFYNSLYLTFLKSPQKRNLLLLFCFAVHISVPCFWFSFSSFAAHNFHNIKLCSMDGCWKQTDGFLWWLKMERN